MNPETIRRIDRLVGQCVCWLLTCHRRLFHAQEISDAGAPRNILFLKLIEQGATVLASSALRRAVDLVGAKNIYFLVFRENRPILDLMGIVPAENVLEIRRDNLGVFLKDVLSALWRLRRVGIEASVDMEFFSRASAILAYLSGAKRRVGLHRFNAEAPYRGDLMTHRIQYNPSLHTAKAYRLLVEALLKPANEVPMLKVPIAELDDTVQPVDPGPASQERMRALLRELSGRELQGPIVLLNPNASEMLPLRKWPTSHFAQLGRELLAAHENLLVVITGGPSEAQAAEAVCRDIGSPSAVSAAGKTSLQDLIALYYVAHVLVTNDSGPAHFATLGPIHTVVLFGPETPRLFGPLGSQANVVSADLACSPCVSVLNHRFSPCHRNVCMELITVEQVFAKVSSILWRLFPRSPSVRPPPAPGLSTPLYGPGPKTAAAPVEGDRPSLPS